MVIELKVTPEAYANIVAQDKGKSVLKKGDFVVTGMGFPAIIMDNFTKRKTRLIHAFGMAEEMGSAYANELRKINKRQFESLKTAMFRKYGSHGQWSAEETARQKKKIGEVV